MEKKKKEWKDQNSIKQWQILVASEEVEIQDAENTKPGLSVTLMQNNLLINFFFKLPIHNTAWQFIIM